MWKTQSTDTKSPIHTVGLRIPAAPTPRNTYAPNWHTRAAFSIHLPGRDAIHQRLAQLLSIGTIGTPQIGGSYYFYTRREGTQNQAVLLVREGLHGKDRALVDANKMSADGTVALDWWFPSDDGKYVAYGTSGSGSENSTLYVIETATRKTCFPIPSSTLESPRSHGKKITPASTTDAIPRKARSPKATTSITYTSSITSLEPMPRKIH